MASLFAALTTAVSGLNAQSSAIGNISDNLANAQTTGYKSVGTEFEELVNASNSTINNPGGVTSTPQYQNDVQGSITSSNTSTSLAISGQGYFAVETATSGSDGSTNFNSQQYYTRQGDFTLDKNGYLVNGSGYYLTGYGITASGAVNTSATAPIQISALLNDPVAASAINYSANLPSNAAVGYTAPASTLLVYDSLGATHSVNYTWTKTGTNTWDLNVNAPDATDSNGQLGYSATIPFTFNDGTNGTTAGTIGSMTDYTTGVLPSFTTTATVPTGNFQYDGISFPYSAITGSNTTTPTVAVSLTDPVTGGTYTKNVALTGLTANATSATNVATNLAAAISQISTAVNGLGTVTGSNSLAVKGSNFGVSGVSATSTGALVSVASWGSGTDQTFTLNSGGTVGAIAWTTGSTVDGTIAVTDPSPYSAVQTQATGDTASVAINLQFAGATTQPLTLGFGTFGGSTGVTQFSDTNSTVSVANFAQNGLPKGSFNSVSIDSSGFVSLNYSNGTNKTIAQIPVAQFYAQDQLQRVSGGAYTATLSSGDARLGEPGTKGAGTLSSNSLEQSNVDIATQFTSLIQAQQVYTANAKVVTTDNSLLQVTLNMIQ